MIHYKARLILVFEYCDEDLKHFISAFKDEDIPMKTIISGMLPFISVDILRILLLAAVPGITLFLPKLLF